jgi:hypothetical protein
MNVVMKLAIAAGAVALAHSGHTYGQVPPAAADGPAATATQSGKPKPHVGSMNTASPGGERESTRIAALTPSGMSPQEACTGFESVMECATALHLAQNLNIPFTDLKARLAAGDPMYAALRGLKPDADAPRELRRAEKEARADTQPPRG